jgi:hypothetical protein
VVVAHNVRDDVDDARDGEEQRRPRKAALHAVVPIPQACSRRVSQ